MKKEDFDRFYAGEDFGLRPATTILTDDKRKVASLAMAIQATMLQLIKEGTFEPTEQLHFMLHLQDFADRLYHGEALAFDGVKQTLFVDSASGNLFHDATEDAFANGHAKFEALQVEAKAQGFSQDNEGDDLNVKRTLN